MYNVHGKMRTVEELIAMGYCRVSGKYGLVSRIDRPDWNKALLNQRIECHCADFYRRVFSRDIVTVNKSDVSKFPSSSESEITYVEVE